MNDINHTHQKHTTKYNTLTRYHEWRLNHLHSKNCKHKIQIGHTWASNALTQCKQGTLKH